MPMKRCASTVLVIISVLLVWKTQMSCDANNSSVRLVGITGTASAGRVEVCMDGVWGTVCHANNSPWSLKNAQVVCRQLGYGIAINSLPQDSLTKDIRAGSSVPIHLSKVECSGTETSLQDCSSSTIHSMSSCTHLTDAAIVCKAAGATAGDVRLVGADNADHRGAVEYYDVVLGWTGVCADSGHSNSWTISTAADVVCAQLGYEGGRPFIQSIDSLFLGVADIRCDSQSFSLSDCSSNRIERFSTVCTTQEAGWVECRKTDAEDYTLRLVGGSREGVLEVAFNGIWGTVCRDALWDAENAEVACKELGLTTEDGYSVPAYPIYVNEMGGTKPVWLSLVDCLRGDESIKQCHRSPIVGYSVCSGNSTTSAEINCGKPIPFRLSGGQIAGIVIGVVSLVVCACCACCACIWVPDTDCWKNRKNSPIWSWCKNAHSHQSVECPPATDTRILEQSHPSITAPAASNTLLDTAAIFKVQSAGFTVGNFAKLNGNHISISPNDGCGLNVVEFDEGGNVIHKQSFDTFLNGQQTQKLVNFINSLPAGRVVAIAAKDEASNQLSEAAKTAIEGFGSKYIRKLGYRGSWILIGRKGAPRGTVLEAGSNVGPVEIVTDTLPMIPITTGDKCVIFVDSAGCQSFGGVQLNVNGHGIGLPERRGIRIAAFKEHCSAVDITCYDTHQDSHKPSKDLAEKINSLPEGSIVVASVFDEASKHLYENAKKALESIGSAQIRNVGYRDAWAIIGRKGASPGSVPESHVRSVSPENSTAVAVGGIVELRRSKVSMNVHPPATETPMVAVSYREVPPPAYTPYDPLGAYPSPLPSATTLQSHATVVSKESLN